MPNYVKNILVFRGNEKDVKECLDGIKSQNDDGVVSAIDFNKIIEMPSPLLTTQEGSDTDFYIDCYRASLKSPDENEIIRIITNSSNKHFYEWLVKLKETDEDEAIKMVHDAVKCGAVLCKNKEEFGDETWYRWANHNWGTKWNALSPEYLSDNTVAFNTAWNGVPKLICALSKMYPEIDILYGYADEDKAGVNCGAFLMHSGNSYQYNMTFPGECNSVLSKIFANRIWDDDTYDLYSFFVNRDSRKPTNILGYLELYVLCTFSDNTATITSINCEFRNEIDVNALKNIADSILDTNCKLYNKEPKSASFVSRDAYEEYTKKYGTGDVHFTFDENGYKVEDNREE